MNKRLLIVDDNRGIRILLRELLSAEGYEIVEADSGQEALLSVEDPDIFLIILDLKMPGMTGIEVLNRIRSLNPDLPVILISAYSDIQLLNKALKAHPNTLFLSKPFDMENVRKMVRSISSLTLMEIAKQNEPEAFF